MMSLRTTLVFSALILTSVGAARAAEGRLPAWEPFSLGAGDGGSFVVTRDFSSTSGPAINIAGGGTEHVEIDLNGFKLSGASSSDVISANDVRSVVIRNGTVDCAAGGFTGIDVGDVEEVTIENVKIRGCNSGLRISEPVSFTVRRNTVLDSVAGSGILVSTFASGNPSARGVIEDNTVRVDATNGIRFQSVGSGVTSTVIRNNRIESASVGLIAAGDGLLISGNTVILSQSDGIRVDPGTTSCKIANNVASMNGDDGFELNGISNCQVLENVASNNARNGIAVIESDQLSIDRNVLNDNGFAGLAFDAASSDSIYRVNMGRGNSFAPGPCASNPAGCAAPQVCDDGTGNTSAGDNFLPGPC